MSSVPTPPRDAPAAALPALLRVPGVSDSGTPKKVAANGREYSVSDIVAASRAQDPRARFAAVRVLGALQGLNRSELHYASSTLYALAHEQSDIADPARQGLILLLSAHSHECEGIHLAIQIVKKSLLDARFKNTVDELATILTDRLVGLGNLEGLGRKELLERRYVLLKAIEAPQLRPAAFQGIRSILENQSDQFRVERKELAGNLLAAIRLIDDGSAGLQEIKRLGSVVFATGFAPTRSGQLREADLERSSMVFVTGHQAEVRKQFGLATALEIRKSIALRGRPMMLDDFEHALRFGIAEGPTAPSNSTWFTRAEWYTVVRLLTLAGREPHIPAFAIAGLFKLLATRIKVERPGDSRDPKKIPDELTSDEREKILRESELVQHRGGASDEEVQSYLAEVETRLLSPEYRSWRYTPPKRDNNETQRFPRGSAEFSKEAMRLIKLLSTSDLPSTIARLTPEELHTIGQLDGLSLDEFRTITTRLRGRAVNDEWARLAILDLVRAPHEESVSAEIRTNVLGGLVAEARRVGRLSHDLEKEVFAVSAEIPALPFLKAHGDHS